MKLMWRGNTTYHYKVITGDSHWFIDKESLSGPGVGTMVDPLFEIVEDFDDNQRRYGKLVKLLCLTTDNHFTSGRIYEFEKDSEQENTIECDTGGLHKLLDTGTGYYSVVGSNSVFAECRGIPQDQNDPLEQPTPSLEQLSEWCQQANVDVTLTSFGTFNVFDGDTERQCEIKDEENLVQLLQIMSSYKESLESFGGWV